MQTGTFDLLQVRVFPDRLRTGNAAAAHVAELLRDSCGRGEARIVFACAPSQTEFLTALVRQTIEWQKVVIFHMDEYCGLDADHPATFRQYLHEHLLRHITPPKAVHLISGERGSEEECDRYAALLAAQPIDVVCAGIGENGHLAFNDPPVADFEDSRHVKIVELDEACRQQQVHDGCFPELGSVPTHALTLTIPALVSARYLSCVVPGERKATAVREALLGPVSTTCPASVLRRHPAAVLHLDGAAASLMPRGGWVEA